MTSEPKIILREGLVDIMRNRFDEQLLQLDNELITMGALCEEAISNAVKYLTTDDDGYKANAIETDRQIDRKERDIENLCMKLLLMQQPVAKDLRKISSALKMISDMERIGDQASDISEIAHFVNSAGYVNKIHITDMTAAAIKMVTDSIDSFVKSDESLAQNVIEQDDGVDNLFLKIKSELISGIQTDDSNAEAMIDLLMIAKYLERIGDHAVNIAEWVIYSITGRHKSLDG